MSKLLVSEFDLWLLPYKKQLTGESLNLLEVKFSSNYMIFIDELGKLSASIERRIKILESLSNETKVEVTILESSRLLCEKMRERLSNKDTMKEALSKRFNERSSYIPENKLEYIELLQILTCLGSNSLKEYSHDVLYHHFTLRSGESYTLEVRNVEVKPSIPSQSKSFGLCFC